MSSIISQTNSKNFNNLFNPKYLSSAASLILLLISYFTIFQGYDQPAKFFWDENYHVAAAQKYLNGIFFMEPHPPLGKLLIALGEKILDANLDDTIFINTDYGRNLPAGYSFAGYRFFPTLLASFCPLVFFLLLKNITNIPIAFITAFLVTTENALIVHNRSAMLEGIQLFFILCFLYSLTFQLKQKVDLRHKLALLSGIFFGLAFCTKINAIILLIPVFFILLSCKRKILAFSTFSAGFLSIFLLIWSIHINIATKIQHELPDSGFYKASENYKADLISEGKIGTNIFSKIYDHLMFLPHYTKGVPKLNFCKIEENGSPWYWWPLGGKSIRYRFDTSADMTSYLYLAVNPVSWLLSFLGIILGISLSLSSFITKLTFSQINLNIIRVLSLSWFTYIMLTTFGGRVFYLYHYFIPLFIGWIILAILLSEIQGLWSRYVKIGLLLILALLQALSFRFFSPLTYYYPLSVEQVENRNWLNIWNIICVNCESTNPVAKSLIDPKLTKSPPIYISGVRAIESYQEWGQAKMDFTVIDKPVIINGVTYKRAIGVHARSRLEFININDLSSIKGKVGLPDYLISKGQAKVVFKISADGRPLWSSNEIQAGREPEPFEVNIGSYKNIILEVTDAGNGNTDDHAVWIEAKFTKN